MLCVSSSVAPAHPRGSAKRSLGAGVAAAHYDYVETLGETTCF